MARLAALYCCGTALFTLEYALIVGGWSSVTPTYRLLFSLAQTTFMVAQCVEFILLPMRGVDVLSCAVGVLGLVVVWLPGVLFEGAIVSNAAARGWMAFESHVDPLWAMGRLLADGPAAGVDVSWQRFRATHIGCYVVGLVAAGASVVAFVGRAKMLLSHVDRKWCPLLVFGCAVGLWAVASITFIPLLIADQTTARCVCELAMFGVSVVAPVSILHLTALLDDRVSGAERPQLGM